MLHLIAARMQVKRALLAAMLAEGDPAAETDPFTAWEAVDKAAVSLAAAARAYRRLARQVAKRAPFAAAPGRQP